MAEKKYIYLTLALICFLVYANSLNNAFVSDDITAIAENSRIAYLGDYRLDPQGLLNSLIYKIAGFNVIPYHLANIILHFLNSLLVFYFLRLFFKTEPSLLSAALFAAHPVHTEAVTWISGRPYLILAFFTLITYFLYHQAAGYNVKKGKKFYASYLSSLCIFSYFIIGNYFYFLFPFFIVLSDIVFGRAKKNWKLWIPFFAILLIRIILAGQTLEQRIAFTLLYDPGKYGAWRNPAFPFIYSIFSHLRLLFYPAKLTFFHEPVIFYPAAMWSGLIALIILACFLPYIFKKAKSIFLGIGIFILFLAPTYSPLPIASIVAERYAYLPSILISILAAFSYEKYSKRINKKLLIAIFILTVVACGRRTFIRNSDWKDTKRFWSRTLQVSPYSPWAHNNMGEVYLKERNPKSALAEFNTALKLNPNLAEAYNNRGYLYYEAGGLSQAASDYSRAIQINPDFAQAYNNRGIVYKTQGKIDAAISDYNQALKINPDYAEVYYNRGNAYAAKGTLTRAISDYDQAIRINPDTASFYANRGAVYFIRQEYDKTWEDIHKAEALGYRFNTEFLRQLKGATENKK